MTKRLTLYDKLKPRVLSKLKENETKYSTSIRQIIAKLENTYFISDLTIDDLRQVHLFSDTSYVDQTAISLIWCDEIFDNDERND